MHSVALRGIRELIDCHAWKHRYVHLPKKCESFDQVHSLIYAYLHVSINVVKSFFLIRLVNSVLPFFRFSSFCFFFLLMIVSFLMAGTKEKRKHETWMGLWVAIPIALFSYDDSLRPQNCISHCNTLSFLELVCNLEKSSSACQGWGRKLGAHSLGCVVCSIW